MSAIRRAYIDGPYGQLHLTRAGAGRTRLLLLHQTPLSGAQFAPALPLLAEAGFDAVALDTPGYGLSDRPAEPVGITGYAAAIPALLDALGWSTAHILGHHTGASIAAAFAARHSDRIDRLILNGLALLSDAERAHFAQFRFAPLEAQADGSHLLAAWSQRLAATPGWTDLRAMHRHTATMLGKPDDYFWGFEAAFAHDLGADLQAIRSSALILTNSGDDLYEASRRAQALRPDFEFHALAGGTHDIVDEQPEAWTAAVIDWLTRS